MGMMQAYGSVPEFSENEGQVVFAWNSAVSHERWDM
jgi:hypothetical protein